MEQDYSFILGTRVLGAFGDSEFFPDVRDIISVIKLYIVEPAKYSNENNVVGIRIKIVTNDQVIHTMEWKTEAPIIVRKEKYWFVFERTIEEINTNFDEGHLKEAVTQYGELTSLIQQARMADMK